VHAETNGEKVVVDIGSTIDLAAMMTVVVVMTTEVVVMTTVDLVAMTIATDTETTIGIEVVGMITTEVVMNGIEVNCRCTSLRIFASPACF